MAKALRDHKGNELKLVLLQILERSDQGPTLCRVRYDHETINLEDPTQREFLMVWTPIDSVLGELRTSDSDTLNELVTAKDQLISARELVRDTKRDIDAVTKANADLTAEIDQKTAALRELQKERDPARFERAVEERTKHIEQLLTLERSTSVSEIATLKSRITELEGSKRKLREALERAKEGKR